MFELALVADETGDHQLAAGEICQRLGERRQALQSPLVLGNDEHSALRVYRRSARSQSARRQVEAWVVSQDLPLELLQSRRPLDSAARQHARAADGVLAGAAGRPPPPQIERVPE